MIHDIVLLNRCCKLEKCLTDSTMTDFHKRFHELIKAKPTLKILKYWKVVLSQ